MNEEEPPKCFLGFSNVRKWSYAVAVLNIDLFSCITMLSIYSIVWGKSGFSVGSCAATFLHALLAIYSVALIIGIKRRNLNLIRDWLWTILVYICLMLLFILMYVFIVCFKGLKQANEMIDKKGIEMILIIACLYTVYKYYKHEKRLTSQEVNA